MEKHISVELIVMKNMENKNNHIMVLKEDLKDIELIKIVNMLIMIVQYFMKLYVNQTFMIGLLLH